ncbi:hypothetical protein LJC40_02325 [Synergistaceae bacterium OttesenSCG-928-D05]|nr:hypothetical protein [Synergistaceae bacterium OttesenSCG-928-D05]
MFINLHGLESNGKNSKYQYLLSKGISPDDIYSPTFDYWGQCPYAVFNILQGRVNMYTSLHEHDNITIIATSYGGFFGHLLHMIFPYIKTVLITPSLLPLHAFEGTRQTFLSQILALSGKYMFLADNTERLDVILARNDTVVDNKLNERLLISGTRVHYLENAGHRVSIDEIGKLNLF